MYRFGISYYIMSAANRIPLLGLSVKLVKPGETFEQGIRLEEKPKKLAEPVTLFPDLQNS